MLSGPLLVAGLPEGAVPAAGSVVGILLAPVFSTVIGELVPKNFALALPLASAKLVVPFRALFTAVFKPVILLFNNTANGIIRSFSIEAMEEFSGARSAEELSSLCGAPRWKCVLDADHAVLLHRTLRFSEHSAADVMTPRVRMGTVNDDDTAERILALAQSTAYSRFPVIGEDRDDVLGFLHLKQAFRGHRGARHGQDHRPDDRTPCGVPEPMALVSCWSCCASRGSRWPSSRTSRLHRAHRDPCGPRGRAVGELEDEHDRSRAGVVRVGRSSTFDAPLRPDELLEWTGIAVPDDEDYDTVVGLVSDQLDRIPEPGDEVDIDGGTLRLERVMGTSVERICFTPDDSEDLPKGPHHRLVDNLTQELTHE